MQVSKKFSHKVYFELFFANLTKHALLLKKYALICVQTFPDWSDWFWQAIDSAEQVSFGSERSVK